MNAEQKAPGCYGSPSIYAMDSDFCKQCVSYAACGEASITTLGQLQKIIDVSDLIKQHEKARKKFVKPSETVTALVDSSGTLPELPMQLERKTTTGRVDFEIDIRFMDMIAKITNTKAQSQALALARSNMIEKAIDGLARGENPFESTPPKFLKVACDMLLAGGFAKASLKKAFIEHLGHTDSTAASHVSITVAILEALQIIEPNGRNFALNRILKP